jgi:uncharacterized protein YdeI (YjbR/CyaY-like superfamily)
MPSKEIDTFCPASRQAWRQWLIKNHSSKQAVWLVYGKKKSGLPTITWSEAVEEALCFGWIDSIKKSIDSERFIQFFSKRKPNSTWSKINKIKIQRLAKQDFLTAAGYTSVETAKANGSWTILDDVEKLIIPKDLEIQFLSNPGSGDFFLSLSKSVRKAMLQWLVLAKKADTRQKRITEIAELAAQKLKPKQF